MDSNERWEWPTVVTKCQIKSDRNVACTPGRDEQAGFCLFMLNDWIFELNGNTVTTLKMCVTVGTGVCAKIASEIHVTCKWDDHENHLDILMLIANSLNAGSMQVFKKKDMRAVDIYRHMNGLVACIWYMICGIALKLTSVQDIRFDSLSWRYLS